MNGEPPRCTYCDPMACECLRLARERYRQSERDRAEAARRMNGASK